MNATERRILLVGPHMQRALALRAAGASVDYLRSAPERLRDPFDGAVIDHEEPADAAEALARLRESDPGLPVVLLVAHPSLAALDGVSVVLPPASGEDILSALPARGPAAVPVPEPRPAEALGAETAPSPPAATATVVARRALAREVPTSLLPEVVEPPVAGKAISSVQSPATLARTARSLTAIAQDLAAGLAGRLGSDVAVLFCRGTVWRVVAGQGLRPLEWRDLEELPPAMALLTDDHPTLSVGNSDDLRSQLIGAPLARHHSVLLTRADDVIVALGRERAYGKAEVKAVREALRTERDGLATARELLRLADALEAHRLP
ncbi:MAG: hypothetical protein ACOYXW_01775 [Actinomycetota bacterium]